MRGSGPAGGALRVAFDARSLASPVPRGWDRYTLGLADALVRAGVSVTLLHETGKPPHPALVEGLGCDIEEIPGRRGLWWEQVALPVALARGRFDVYHAPAEHGIPFVSPCPTVLTIHSATAHSYDDLVRRGLLRGSLRDYVDATDPHGLRPSNVYWHAEVARADWVLAPSAFAKEEIVRLLGRGGERVTVTPLGVPRQFQRRPPNDAARARTLAALGVKGRYLLYVGGYERHKNVPGLLRVFARARARCPDVTLVLVGSGAAPRELPGVAITLGLEPCADVVFLSGLGEELTDLYDGAELFVTLSWRESFCLPALEAMARGLPVTASSWGATREVADGAGVFVDPRDEPAAAIAIAALLEDPGRRLLGERGRELAAQFNWDRTAGVTLDVYERAARSGA